MELKQKHQGGLYTSIPFALLTFLILNLCAFGALEINPVEDYMVSGPEGGPFEPSQKIYSLTNTDATSIIWGLSESAGWIDCAPEWGPLDPNESVNVTVSINTASELLSAGEYIEDIIFTDITNGIDDTRQVILSVGSASPGPVGWWQLDGDATDSSPNGYHGTPYGGPVWITEGKDGGAIQLDGVDDYVEAVGYQGITGGNSRTTCAWIKIDETFVDRAMILSWGQSSLGNTWSFRVGSITADPTSKLELGIWGGVIRGTTPLNDSNWHHVAVVLEDDGSASLSEVRLYVDGDQESTTLYGYVGSPPGIHTVADDNVCIGMKFLDGVGNYYFDGILDDVQIFDRALTQAEINKVAWGGSLVVLPNESFDALGEPGGPFTPAYKDYTLKNFGTEVLYWGIDALPDWVDVDSSFGGLDPNESTTVRVSLTNEADLFGEGLYTETVLFNNLSTTQDPVIRDVNLDIQYIRGIWASPESFDITLTEGTQQDELFTVGNDGTETLNFSLRSRTVVGSASASTQESTAAAPHKMIFDSQQALQHEHQPGQVLVRFTWDSEIQNLPHPARQQALSRALPDAVFVKEYRTIPGLSLVQLPEDITIEDALESFNARDDVLYVQPNYRVYADSVFPNDTRFNDLWGLHNTGQSGGQANADIDAPEAWDISTGSESVIVAVIDTGVDYNHEDLAANMWVNQLEYNGTGGVDDDGNGYVDDIYGYDFDHGDGDPMDDHYHGTHCAGTIGAVGNNGKGVTGVCWNVEIMAVKFLDSGGNGWTSDAIDSVEYATLMGAHIMSNSWGGGAYDQGLKDAIDAAGANGILFVAAAGNDSVNNDTYPHYPSSYTSSNIVSVMSTDRNDLRSSFTNWGPTSVDIGAPGTSILSCEPGNQYQYLNGTSMATPHVAGACALLQSINPSLNVSETKDIIMNSVDSIFSLTGRCVSEGRLNINNAILETTVPWIEFDIEQGSLGPDQSLDVTVTFNAIGLAPDVYYAEILVLSDDPANPQLTIPVTLTVLPDPLEVAPEAGFDPNGFEGGPFEPNSTMYTLSNTGDVALDWSIQWQANWLGIDQTAGTLEPDENIAISISLNPSVELLEPNFYLDTVVFNNLTVGSVQHRDVTLSVRPTDKFTEVFDNDDFDLAYYAIIVRPDDVKSYYLSCVESDSAVDYFTDPTGGTQLSMGDDDYAEIIFSAGKQMDFYGIAYDRVYVGSNGYLTFGQGDTEFDPTLEYHFGIPRISALFTDLTPTDEQSVSYIQLDDRFVVTYQDVPVFGDKTATNSFQVELFFADGAIRMTYLNIDASEIIAGLSNGHGKPGFFEESNLSNYLNCCECGDMDGNNEVGLPDLCNFALAWMDAGCAVPGWCLRSDFNRSGQVDMADFTLLSQNWQRAEYAWSEPEFLLELNGKVWTEPQYFPELDDSQGNKAKAPGLSQDLLTIFYNRHVPELGYVCLFQASRPSIVEPFANERRLDELIQTGGGRGGPWLSADGQRLYYHEVHPDTNEMFIKTATWSSAENLWVYERTFDEIHYAGYRDSHPSVTDDELTIFFGSTRPDGVGTSAIWTASRTSQGDAFSNIHQLTELPEPNGIEVAHTPSVLPDGLTLYFNATNSEDGNPAFYKVTRSSLFEPFTNLEEIEFPGHETMWELNCYVSPDGKALYFQTGDAAQHGGIWVTTFEPEPSNMPAGHPHVSHDGLTMYYNRDVPELGHKCIFQATRSDVDEPFGNETILSELIQTGGSLGSPWLSADGQRLYYHEHHPAIDGSMMKMAVWSQAENQWIYQRTLDEIHYGPNTTTILASLPDDELSIFWCSTRPDGTGGWDVWTASRSNINDPFENIQEVGEINTSFSDSSPSILPDGLTLYFNSRRRNGSTQDLYRVTRSSYDEPFANIELVDIAGFESDSKLHPYVTYDEQGIYFESSKNSETGCYVTEFVPVTDTCLQR